MIVNDWFVNSICILICKISKWRQKYEGTLSDEESVIYPGYQRFFLAYVGELRFVGRRPTHVRPKAEDTSGEAARKNLRYPG